MRLSAHLFSGMTMAIALLATAGSLHAVDAVIDFAKPIRRIVAADGAGSVGFDRAPIADNGYRADVQSDYSNFDGWPDDSANTAYGRFCDTAWGADSGTGMALHNLWAGVSSEQTPEGTVGKTWDSIDWSRLDFSMYEGAQFDPDEWFLERKWNYQNYGDMYAHTWLMMRDAAERCRRNNTRMVFWTDVFLAYPRWMWENPALSNSRPGYLADDKWEEAALHLAIFHRMAASKYGIPMYGVCNVNEPNQSKNRMRFTHQSTVEFTAGVSDIFAQAGLGGVRTAAAWYKTDGIDDMANHLRANPQLQNKVDILTCHHPSITNSITQGLTKTQYWCGAGPNVGYYATGQKDWALEDDRLHVDLLENLLDQITRRGWDFNSTWQTNIRVGCEYGIFPTSFDPTASRYRAEAMSCATVWPFVRPGMWIMDGSQTSERVYALGGRGHPEVIVLFNKDADSRTISAELQSCPVTRFTTWQWRAGDQRRRLADTLVSGGVVSVSVPGDGIVTLVAEGDGGVPRAFSSLPQAYLVVKASGNLTANDIALRNSLQASGFAVEILPQQLTDTIRVAHRDIRHPIDPLGAAAYVISDSVDDDYAIMAHDVAAAPVFILGGKRGLLGLSSGQTVEAGKLLGQRRTFDPPATLLDSGVPRACGFRRHLSVPDTAGSAALAALSKGGCVPTPAVAIGDPPIIDGVSVADNPVIGTVTTLQVEAHDPDSDPLTYAWSVDSQPVGAAVVVGSGEDPTVTFDKAGPYRFRVTVTDATLLADTATVDLTVQQTVNKLEITP